MAYRIALLFLVLVFSFFQVSSGRAASPSVSGRVAIVDLDVIAKTFGRDKVMSEQVRAFIKKNETAINKRRKELRLKLDVEKKKMGDKPNAAPKKKYDQMVAQAEQELRQEVAEARKKAGQLRAKLVGKFKNEVQVLAVKIAGLKGFSLVLLKQPGMLYIDPNVDISNDVAKMMAAEATGKK